MLPRVFHKTGSQDEIDHESMTLRMKNISENRYIAAHLNNTSLIDVGERTCYASNVHMRIGM